MKVECPFCNLQAYLFLFFKLKVKNRQSNYVSTFFSPNLGALLCQRCELLVELTFLTTQLGCCSYHSLDTDH